MRLIDADSLKQILNHETIGGIIVASIIDTREFYKRAREFIEEGCPLF